MAERRNPLGEFFGGIATGIGKLVGGIAQFFAQLGRAVFFPLIGLFQRGDGWGADRSYRGGIHQGIDYRAPRGTPVTSMVDGVVTAIRNTGSARNNGHGGTYVTVRGNVPGKGELEIDYMHLDSVASELRMGQRIRAGQPIGTVGNSGTSASRRGDRDSGAHLHLQARQPGTRNYVKLDDYMAKAESHARENNFYRPRPAPAAPPAPVAAATPVPPAPSPTSRYTHYPDPTIWGGQTAQRQPVPAGYHHYDPHRQHAAPPPAHHHTAHTHGIPAWQTAPDAGRIPRYSAFFS